MVRFSPSYFLLYIYIFKSNFNPCLILTALLLPWYFSFLFCFDYDYCLNNILIPQGNSQDIGRKKIIMLIVSIYFLIYYCQALKKNKLPHRYTLLVCLIHRSL